MKRPSGSQCRAVLDTLTGLSRCHLQPVALRSTHRSYGTSARRMNYASSTNNFVPLSDTHAYIAVGSNVGSRIANIEQAQSLLNSEGLPVTRTSRLYETAPMYYEDQRRFVNGVFEVRTSQDCSSPDLLRKVKSIEARIGRNKTFENGPREIDLDILLHGQNTFESSDLTVPHKEMLEREFVLRPLADLIPNTSHPGLPGYSYGRRLARLAGAGPSATMPSIVSMSPRIAHFAPSIPTRQTQLMAVLNLTPDSFSDGGVHLSDTESVAATCDAMRRAGASIIDIGGQSTRPGAAAVGATEELARILPIVRRLRSDPTFDGTALSIDTYHASVAAAAMDAGADFINDISGGTLDAEMLAVAAQHRYPIVLMHMRGDPATMNRRTDYSAHAGGDIVASVAAELAERVAAALAAGVRPWRIMLDPGIGFAKTGTQNLELLRRLPELRRSPALRGFPWLVGASRKSFIGRITAVKEPEKRTWGTAATVAAAIQGGADVVRVHDVAEMAQVAAVADAIYRMRGDKPAVYRIEPDADV